MARQRKSELDKFKLQIEDTTDRNPVVEAIRHLRRRRKQPSDVAVTR